MKWISVEKRLPEEEQEVLCWGRDMFYIGIYTKKNDFLDLYQYGIHSTELHRLKDVTHWQPLPSAPEIE